MADGRRLPNSLLRARASGASDPDAWISRPEAAQALGVSVWAIRKYEHRHLRVRREHGRVWVSRADVAIVAARLGRAPTAPDDASLSRALARGDAADAIVEALGVDYQRIASVADARDRLMACASVPRRWLAEMARALGAALDASAPIAAQLDAITRAARVVSVEAAAWRAADRRSGSDPVFHQDAPKTADKGPNEP